MAFIDNQVFPHQIEQMFLISHADLIGCHHNRVTVMAVYVGKLGYFAAQPDSLFHRAMIQNYRNLNQEQAVF